MSPEPAQEALLTIASDRLSAGITTFGAALWDLRLAGHDRSLVLGFATVADYVASRTHAGSVVGRVCNRLGNGQARLGDRVLRLDRNVPPYHLHGGVTGFSQQRWRVAEHMPNSLTLALHSPDGHEGYPGNLSVRARYSVVGATLRLEFSGTTDAPTLLNMTHHAYFNLSDRDTVDDHTVTLNATRYLESDADLVPTGRLGTVEGSHLDFRHERTFREAQHPGTVVNHTMILSDTPRLPLTHAATVAADRRLEVWTTQPALHVYDGYRIAPGTPLRDGSHAGPRAGFCLEAQGWTDAPNHDGFVPIVLMPEEQYYQNIEYRFD
ncbi:MAG: aldose epimerase family protein [Paracoccaceae bacterium]